MKNNLLLMFVFLMLTSGIIAQSEKKTINLKPEKPNGKVLIKISEKTQHYYALNQDNPTTISTQGPGKIRVITRGRFVHGVGNRISYRVLYSVDGGIMKTVKESGVERSKEAKYLHDTLGDPGELKSFEIELGRGAHTIDFKLQDTRCAVSARFIFTQTNLKKKDWVEFSPEIPSEPVDLVTKEEIVKYYRFSTEKPMVIQINGPTELQVFTRIENHYQMKGRINYRVQVTENARIINTYQLNSIRSEVTFYKADEKLIPGKACEFVIKVPKGKHTYMLFPMDKDKSTLLGRLLIPKKSISLKE